MIHPATPEATPEAKAAKAAEEAEAIRQQAIQKQQKDARKKQEQDDAAKRIAHVRVRTGVYHDVNVLMFFRCRSGLSDRKPP
jgi:hypothetical protein